MRRGKMIRVVIETINGSDTGAEKLGEMKIESSVTEGRSDWNNYQYIIDNSADRIGRIDRQFKSNSIWKLIYKILEQEFNEE
jgi:hypothetical protein